MTITPADVAAEHRVFVARYDADDRPAGLHFDIDADFAERLKAAAEGAKPPEGGRYRIYPILDARG